MGSGYIYVISTKYRPQEYKIGKHTGSKGKLISRYKTYLSFVKVEYFTEHKDYKNVEIEMHNRLREYTVKNDKGKCTEWYKCNLNYIIDILNNYSKSFYIKFENDYIFVTKGELKHYHSINPEIPNFIESLIPDEKDRNEFKEYAKKLILGSRSWEIFRVKNMDTKCSLLDILSDALKLKYYKKDYIIGMPKIINFKDWKDLPYFYEEGYDNLAIFITDEYTSVKYLNIGIKYNDLNYNDYFKDKNFFLSNFIRWCIK